MEFLAFHAILSVLLGAMAFGLRLAFNSKNEDNKKDPVLQSILGGGVIFTLLIRMMPNAL